MEVVENAKDIELQIEELKNQLEYERLRLLFCGYDTRDLMYVEGIERELAELKRKL